MKKIIRIKFVDFVSKFDPFNNYFYNLLSEHYNVIISDKPDILICSCYGYSRYKYTCLKIYYTGENHRVSFAENDFAMSFDFLNKENHYRLPLYALYIEHAENQRKNGRLFSKFSKTETITDALCRRKTEKEAREIWRSKKKFCCFINSNPAASNRIECFQKLSEYKTVDSGGAVLNNIGYRVADKIDFIKDYRFVFSFENSSYKGYTTEKIVEPFFVDSIPLYWGNPMVHLDFNTRAFVNFHDYNHVNEFIRVIIEIDQDEELAIKMLMEPKFNNGIVNNFINEQNVINFLTDIIDNRDKIIPVSKTLKGRYHNMRQIAYNKELQLKEFIKKIIKYKS